jgi:hypothetical protein
VSSSNPQGVHHHSYQDIMAKASVLLVNMNLAPTVPSNVAL